MKHWRSSLVKSQGNNTVIRMARTNVHHVTENGSGGTTVQKRGRVQADIESVQSAKFGDATFTRGTVRVCVAGNLGPISHGLLEVGGCKILTREQPAITRVNPAIAMHHHVPITSKDCHRPWNLGNKIAQPCEENTVVAGGSEVQVLVDIYANQATIGIASRGEDNSSSTARPNIFVLTLVELKDQRPANTREQTNNTSGKKAGEDKEISQLLLHNGNLRRRTASLLNKKNVRVASEGLHVVELGRAVSCGTLVLSKTRSAAAEKRTAIPGADPKFQDNTKHSITPMHRTSIAQRGIQITRINMMIVFRHIMRHIMQVARVSGGNPGSSLWRRASIKPGTWRTGHLYGAAAQSRPQA